VESKVMEHIGHIEIVVGSMFSGKTEELIRRVRRAQYAKQTIQCFKPQIDNRYDKERIVSHRESFVEALPVEDSTHLARSIQDNTQVVALDEAQFFDHGVVQVVTDLADRGVRVLIAGLDQDFQGKPFGPIPHLMAIAEEVTKVRAICTVCGQEASRTYRITKSQDQVQVGGHEAYEARCRKCHKL
jgi:thymidine kinase